MKNVLQHICFKIADVQESKTINNFLFIYELSSKQLFCLQSKETLL